jgi:hypothetical protein
MAASVLTLNPVRVPRLWLAVVLMISATLRGVLVWRGGQQFWPDESRYVEARVAVGRMAAGEWREAWAGLLGAPEHVLFKIVGLMPAAGERVLGGSQWGPALFFAMFSVLALWLVGWLARAAGGNEWEALAATALAAGANCLFYYSRHFFPYDLALCFGLWAWGLAPASGRGASLMAGAAASLCFLSYNGYWLLGGAALIAHGVLAWRGGAAWVLRRWAWAALGLALPMGALAGAAALLGVNLARGLAGFSGTITHGGFGTAWRSIPEFFWAAEGFNAVLLALTLIATVILTACRRARPAAVLGLAAAAVLLAALVLLSDGVRIFVSYGRLARMAVPFACLAAGSLAVTAWRRGGGWTWGAASVLALYFGQAAVNFSVPLRQWFPSEFSARAARLVAEQNAREPGNWRMIHASFYFTPESIAREALPGPVLWTERHPQQWAPYLFEGASPAERAEFLVRDGAMRLIRIGAEANRGWLGADPALSKLAGYPGRVSLRLRFPSDRLGTAEPLVVTGESGRGDLIYVVYQDAAHIRIGFDHWAVSGTVSPNLVIDWTQPHEIVVGLGSLFPATHAGQERQRLWVTFDGRVLFDRPQEFHPSQAGAVIFGLNLIGGSTTGARFNGVIESVAPAL